MLILDILKGMTDTPILSMGRADRREPNSMRDLVLTFRAGLESGASQVVSLRMPRMSDVKSCNGSTSFGLSHQHFWEVYRGKLAHKTRISSFILVPLQIHSNIWKVSVYITDRLIFQML
jgi:hypothetical protein